MKTYKVIFQLGSLLSLLILAALPLAFSYSTNKVGFDLLIIPHEILQFLKGLFDGSSFYYNNGGRIGFFPHDVQAFFLSSFLYLVVAGVFVILFSILFGIWLYRRSEKGLHSIVGFIGMIPDFILVFLLQWVVILIYQATGIKVARVATFTLDAPAVLLPLITLFILPFFYLVNSLSDITSDVVTKDYIRTARSKGLSNREIYLYHVTTNVTPYLKADLHKVVSIMIGNLFIIEYLYNNKGLISMIFPLKFYEYQYNLLTLSFLSFFVLYLSVYYTMRIIVRIIERILRA